MVITPDNRWLYVASDGASTVSVIDTATDTRVADIDVGKNPHGVAVTPDGKTVLVGVYDTDSVVFIDTATRTVSAKVSVGKPHNIAVHPDGRLAYVGSQTPGKFALAVIDLARRTVRDFVALDKTPRGLEFAPDGKHLFITQAGLNDVVAIDPATNKAVRHIAAGVSPHYANFTADGRFGLTAVQGPSQLVVFSPHSFQVERTVKVGSRPHWVAPGPDNRTALTTNEDSNDVSFVDLTTGAVTTIAVGSAPRKIAVQTAVGPQSSLPATITIKEFAFNPVTLEVVAGTTVTWVNDDGAPHAVSVRGGAASDTLMPTQRFSARFDLAGEIDYLCSVHPYMTGKLVITRR